MNDRIQLEIAKNIATNGRLFCVLIFAVALAAFLRDGNPWFARLAVLSAVPVGLSAILDHLPVSAVRLIASITLYAFTAFLAAVIFVSI